MHAFHGVTLDTNIVAMQPRNPSLLNHKSLCISISRVRYTVDLVTDDGPMLSDHLQGATE